MKKMLITIAHPSDECFMAGGTIAKYKKAGWDIRLICATNGEKGRTDAFSWVAGDALGPIRQEELSKACEKLGISTTKFLGLKDGKLGDLTPGTMEDPIHDYMMEYLPDVVVTFDTLGLNNDPDHRKVCYATTFAFQKYAAYLEDLKDKEKMTKGRGKEWRQSKYMQAFGDVGEEGLLPKLYYGCYPESVLLYLQKIQLFYPVSFDKPWGGAEDKMVTTTVDISRFRKAKEDALKAHVSQWKDIEPFTVLPNNPLLQNEYFILRRYGIFEVFMGKTDRVSDRL